jgi:maltose-binding protein MalE
LHWWARSIGVSALAIATLGSPACALGNHANNTPTVNRTGTITIWHSWQGSYLDAKKAIFDSYTKQYPNVTINLVHQDDVAAAVASGVSSGGPDIAVAGDDALGGLVKLDAIKPIDGLDGVDTNYMAANFSKAAVDVDSINGHIYGMPETVETVTMIYNKDLVSSDQVPKTTDALYAFAKDYSLKHRGSYGVVWNSRSNAFVNAPWVYGFGGYYVKADGTVGLTTQGTKDAFNYIAGFKGLIPTNIADDVADTLFKTKKAAIIINGPQAVHDYDAAGIHYGLAVLPTIKGGSPAQPLVRVKTLMVTSTAQNPALAVDVIKWFDNKDNEVAQALANQEVPANTAALNDPQVQAVAQIQGFSAQVQNGTPLPNTPYMAALWDPVAKALEAVWTGKMNVNDALAAAQQAAQTNISQLK